MNISHYPVDSNRAIIVAIQGTNQSKYLQPDYFLVSSNNSFLGKKYNKVQQRISRIVSAALLSGLVLTTSVDANASSNSTVPVLPYMQDHGTQGHHTAKPMMPPPSAFGLEMKSNITNVSGKSEGRSAILESIRNFGKKALKKVKRESKPKVVSSDGDLMSDLHNTLERRRKGVAGEEDSSTKPKKVVKQAPKMTEKEWQEIKKKRLEEAAEIARKNAALREYNAKVTAEAEKESVKRMQHSLEPSESKKRKKEVIIQNMGSLKDNF